MSKKKLMFDKQNSVWLPSDITILSVHSMWCMIPVCVRVCSCICTRGGVASCLSDSWSGAKWNGSSLFEPDWN